MVTQGDGLVVITAMEMPDWEVRQHRSTLIRFEDRTWRVAARRVAAGKIHYELARWDVADHERAGREVDYNAAYVALRDQAAPKHRARNRTTGFLRWISPLIGFLPARTKARLEALYGVDPVSTTFQSVFCEFLVVVMACALVTIGGLTRQIGLWPIVGIALVIALDGSVRYGRILAEERPPPGFYEWAFKKHRGVN